MLLAAACAMQANVSLICALCVFKLPRAEQVHISLKSSHELLASIRCVRGDASSTMRYKSTFSLRPLRSAIAAPGCEMFTDIE